MQSRPTDRLWQRIRTALLQEAQSVSGGLPVAEVLAFLPDLIMQCGEFSWSRPMILRIGRTLLQGRPKIVAPACPDYEHSGGRYTFRGLGGDVSLLAAKHIAFLQAVAKILPEVEVLILIADHEADDKELCRATGATREEFSTLVARTVQETQDTVAPLGWNAQPMTSVFGDLVAEETRIASWITSNAELQSRISTETIMRAAMYRRIRRSFTAEEMTQRTIRTAAQYVALGTFAASHGYLICNHTTINLSWYLQTEAAVLHNSISVY